MIKKSKKKEEDELTERWNLIAKRFDLVTKRFDLITKKEIHYGKGGKKMCKKLKNANFKFTGKFDPEKKNIKVGETEFIKDQFEEGVAKKLKGASKTSLFYVHGSK